MKRGQVALEYIILIGALFLALIPIFYYALQQSSQNIRMNEANDFVNTLAATADMVYALGPGSQDRVRVIIPSGVKSISVSGNEILLKLSIFGGVSDIYATTKANLTGELPVRKGICYISVKTLENGIVQIRQ